MDSNIADLTEYRIQNLLYLRLSRKQHRYVVPNTMALKGEQDLVSVTRKGYIYEYEIKVSRADYTRDKGKIGKHYLMRNGVPGHIPNYYYYVAPAGIIDPKELEDHQGLITIDQHGADADVVRWQGVRWYVGTAKRAKRLHDDTITDRHKTALNNTLSTKYWQLRLNEL